MHPTLAYSVSGVPGRVEVTAYVNCMNLAQLKMNLPVQFTDRKYLQTYLLLNVA